MTAPSDNPRDHASGADGTSAPPATMLTAHVSADIAWWARGSPVFRPPCISPKADSRSSSWKRARSVRRGRPECRPRQCRHVGAAGRPRGGPAAALRRAAAGFLGDGPLRRVRPHRASAIACEAVRAGTLHCAVGRSGEAELAERERQWKRQGAPVRLLDRAETVAKPAAKPIRRRFSICGRAPCSRSPMRAASPRSRSPHGARIFTQSPVTVSKRVTAAGSCNAFGRGGGWARDRRDRHLRRRALARSGRNSSGFPISTSRPARSATICGARSCPTARAPGTPARCSAPSAWTRPAGSSSARSERSGDGRAYPPRLGAARSAAALPAARRRRLRARMVRMIGTTQDAVPRCTGSPGILSISGYNGRGIRTRTPSSAAASPISFSAGSARRTCRPRHRSPRRVVQAPARGVVRGRRPGGPSRGARI